MAKAKKNGNDIESFDELPAFLISESQKLYKNNLAYLRSCYNVFASEFSKAEDIDTLQKLNGRLLKQIRKLKRIKNSQTYSDNASVLDAFEVTRKNGKTQIINEGLHDRLNVDYANVIEDLEAMQKEVEYKILQNAKNIKKHTSFESFIIYGDPEKLDNALKNLYTNAKPRYIAAMIIALIELDYLKDFTNSLNGDQVHKILKAYFKDIGDKRSITGAIKTLKEGRDSKPFSERIDIAKSSITFALK